MIARVFFLAAVFVSSSLKIASSLGSGNRPECWDWLALPNTILYCWVAALILRTSRFILVLETLQLTRFFSRVRSSISRLVCWDGRLRWFIGWPSRAYSPLPPPCRVVSGQLEWTVVVLFGSMASWCPWSYVGQSLDRRLLELWKIQNCDQILKTIIQKLILLVFTLFLYTTFLPSPPQGNIHITHATSVINYIFVLYMYNISISLWCDKLYFYIICYAF